MPGPIPRQFILETGDILLSRSGTIGRSFLVPGDVAGLTFAGFLVRFRPRADQDARYLSYALQSEHAQAQVQADAIVSTIQNFNAERYANLALWVPPLADQRRIADFLDDQVAVLDRAQELRDQQRSLILERDVTVSRVATTVGLLDGPRMPTGIKWMPEIAADWKMFKIGRAFRTGSGTTPKADNPAYFGGTYPWINTGDLRDGKVDAPNRFVTEVALADYSSLKFYEPGTLLVAMYGATIGRLGRLGIRACLNQACCAIYKPTEVSLDYAYYWFLGHRNDIVKMGTGGGQPNISQEVITALRIPSPSTGIQVEIVKMLEGEHQNAENLLELLARQTDLYLERKQALITAAVTGQIDVATARIVA